MAPRATVVIPTFDHGPLLAHPLRAALSQTVADLEVFVVGDGVPDATRDLVRDIERRDERVRFFDSPKGERNGEANRHAALAQAAGSVVCYLSDDDLWLPDHVEVMLGLLRRAHVASAATLSIRADGTPRTWLIDLADPADRRLVLQVENRIPLSAFAHTLDAYRRLPRGWMPAPPGALSDLFFYRQVLAERWVVAASGTRPTVLNFPSPFRSGWSADRRLAELDRWARWVDDPVWRAEQLPELTLGAMRNSWRESDRRLRRIVLSPAWTIGARVARGLRSWQATRARP